MRSRSAFHVLRWVLLGILVLLALSGISLWWYFHPSVDRTTGIVYETFEENPLTLDIIRPKNPNGAAVLLMVSGSWISSQGSVGTPVLAPLLRRGFTVIAVRHQSQPKASVMEIVEQVRRAVQTVRFRAEEFGIHPDRIGVAGGSSGGHLALWLATRGTEGNPQADDPVERQSSGVQSVACFFPATDLLNLGDSTENAGDGGPPRSYRAAFRESATNFVVWKSVGRELSPIYHVHSKAPPVLIIHGDADTLVPLDQSERFQAAAKEVGMRVELIVRRGKGHGWPEVILETRHFASWFESTLLD